MSNAPYAEWTDNDHSSVIIIVTTLCMFYWLMPGIIQQTLAFLQNIPYTWSDSFFSGSMVCKATCIVPGNPSPNSEYRFLESSSPSSYWSLAITVLENLHAYCNQLTFMRRKRYTIVPRIVTDALLIARAALLRQQHLIRAYLGSGQVCSRSFCREFDGQELGIVETCNFSTEMDAVRYIGCNVCVGGRICRSFSDTLQS